MNEARESLARIDDWLVRLGETAAGKIDKRKIDMQPGQEFEEALDDDLNISAALGFLFEKIRETNRAVDRNELDAASANAWLNWWERINKVLEVEEKESVAAVAIGGRLGMKGTLSIVHIKGGPLPPEIANLLEERAQARLAKDWRKSDELRDELSARGWELRDIKDGQEITRRAAG
jgi:cysteinyl-tRNA synthetase